MDIVAAFQQYTLTDGMIVGGWMAWMAWQARALANSLHSAKRHKQEFSGRVVALAFMLIGSGLFYAGWSQHPEGGPSPWSAIGGLGWALSWLNVRSVRKTGKPLL